MNNSSESSLKPPMSLSRVAAFIRGTCDSWQRAYRYRCWSSWASLKIVRSETGSLRIVLSISLGSASAQVASFAQPSAEARALARGLGAVAVGADLDHPLPPGPPGPPD